MIPYHYQDRLARAIHLFHPDRHPSYHLVMLKLGPILRLQDIHPPPPLGMIVIGKGLIQVERLPEAYCRVPWTWHRKR